MIKLTTTDDQLIYFSPDKIIAVYGNADGTSLDTGDDSVYPVKETPEEVVQKIMDYKLCIDRQAALSQRWANEEDKKEILKVSYQLEMWEDNVRKLSGLER